MNPLIKLLVVLILLLFPINTAVIESNSQYASSSPTVITWPGMNIDSNCYIYMPGGICQQCKFGYYFHIDRCVQGNRNCKTYNPYKNVCESCFIGSKLINDACVINTQTYLLQGCSYSSGDQCLYCSPGYYFNINGVCELIDTLCDEFDFNSRLCKRCYKGYTYKQNWGKCVASELQLNSYCQALQNDKCLSCMQDYFLHQSGQCIQTNKHCLEVDSTDLQKCSSCEIGYLLTNGNCKKAQQNNYNIGCLKSNENGTCISCSYRMILDSNNKCVMINPLCQTYDNNGYCLSCYQSSKLIENSCIPNDYQVKNKYCSSWSQGICKSCIPWAYLDSNNICQIVNTLCRSYDQKNGVCTSCYGGYYLVNGQCKSIQRNPNCLSLSDNLICTACYNGYYLNKLTNICQLADSLCLTITQDNNCLSCYYGYKLTNNKCVIQQLHCTNYNEKGLCSQCNKGYHIEGKNCVPNRVYCAQYDDLLDICRKCRQKYIIYNEFCQKINPIVSQQPTQNLTSAYDKNCALWSNSQQVCLSCDSQSFFNKSGLCQKVSDFCQSFDSNNGSCLNCYRGFSIIDGSCMINRKNCDQIDQKGQCLSCYVGYYLQDGDCKIIDPLCQSFNKITLNCEKCYDGYILRNSICIMQV